MSAEERFLEAAIAYLGRRLGPRAVLNRVVIDATGSDGIKQEVKLDGRARRASSEEEEGTPPGSIMAAIREVMGEAERPLKGATIARRAGRAFSGAFRSALASMTRDGELRLTEEGYEVNEGEDGRDSQQDGSGR